MWIIRSGVTVIVDIVDDYTGTIVVAERCPAPMVIGSIPVNPTRAPVCCGDPIPPDSQPPMPAAVMTGDPSPRLVGEPGPAADRIPEPTAVMIRPPSWTQAPRNPHLAVWRYVNPLTVGGQFIFKISQLCGKVAACQSFLDQDFSVVIPSVEGVFRYGHKS